MAGTADTFKFSTFLWLVAGLLIPLWPLSLPLCWFFAYRSYTRAGRPRGAPSQTCTQPPNCIRQASSLRRSWPR